jgi:hypothetical protein
MGNVPGSPSPNAGEEHTSNAPEQSAKLMIIEGVPAGNALPAPNSPSVFCVPGSSVALNERDTAAYSTLQGPLANDTMLPNSKDEPPP